MAETATASSHGGMGAVPYDGGVAFRVWAPHAGQVSVAGDFNDWSEDATPLAHEGSGYWSTDVAGVKPGNEYRFVLGTQGGTVLWRNDPYARDVTSSVGNSIVCSADFDWGDTDFTMPSWNELVIYELHVGTFNDAPGGHAGSFESVERRLSYLRDLGINGLELMPSAEFAADFSWGYNPAQIFAIESAYGGPDALKRLVRAAHEHGIAVIFDVVYNHLGPSDLDMWQFDGWTPNGKGGIYFYNDARSQTPWGDTRPDYGRHEVREFLRDNARMWLEEFRFDGLRWDATAYIRNVYGNNDDPGNDIPDGWRLLQDITRDTDQRQPWKLHIAEDLRDNAWITAPPSWGGAGFDTQWDGRFVHPVRAILKEPFDGARNMEVLRHAIVARDRDDPVTRVIYTESHDEVANGKSRLPHEISPSDPGNYFARKRSTLGAVLVFTTPGMPMIFQGQEILEDEWFRDDDPIDWTKADTYAGVFELYRDLIRLRRNWYDNTRGLRGPHVNVHHVNDDDNVIAFHRWERGGPRDDVVVALNVSNRERTGYRIGFPRSGAWRSALNSDSKAYGDDYGDIGQLVVHAHGGPYDGMPHSGEVSLGRYSAIILSQDG
jgi:1,4-alpha-glucan branching enzyme